MGFFWEKGPLFVKEMLAFYEEPKPHFNTLSTIVRGLEDKGIPEPSYVRQHVSVLCGGQRGGFPQADTEERYQQIFQ